jgi:repressor of nif and glnA expression
LSKGFVKGGKRYRGIKLFDAAEMRLLEAVASGDFVTSDFTNGDLSERMYGRTSDTQERLRRANRISYRLRLMRAHGLIRKVPRRNRYQISNKGREKITSLLQLQNANMKLLNSIPT